VANGFAATGSKTVSHNAATLHRNKRVAAGGGRQKHACKVVNLKESVDIDLDTTSKDYASGI
jgi:hypothetical protein